jgi:hypothetical protein
MTTPKTTQGAISRTGMATGEEPGRATEADI